MEWQDDALVLGIRKHGENSVILEVMTRDHGRHLGLVRGGRSRRSQAALQAGNTLRVTWRARLEDQLGQFIIEPITMRAARLMATPEGVYGVQFLASILRLLPERQQETSLYDVAAGLVETFDEPGLSGAILVRLELAVLEELGFGLDLNSCAATGSLQELIYVSPKSGRAVSRRAGEPYRDKLLSLPSFLTSQLPSETPETKQVLAGFELSGFFYKRHIWNPRDMYAPDVRDGFISLLKRRQAV